MKLSAVYLNANIAMVLNALTARMVIFLIITIVAMKIASPVI